LVGFGWVGFFSCFLRDLERWKRYTSALIGLVELFGMSSTCFALILRICAFITWLFLFFILHVYGLVMGDILYACCFRPTAVKIHGLDVELGFGVYIDRFPLKTMFFTS
jgi:hypothetical protein